jgi:hypothetical protein
MTQKQINASFLPSIKNGEVPKTFGLVPIYVACNCTLEFGSDNPVLLEDIPEPEYAIKGVRKLVLARRTDVTWNPQTDGAYDLNGSI